MTTTNSASSLEAPFENDAVFNLNTFQTHTSGGFVGHPYTCANRSDGMHGEEGGDLGVLIATTDGWVCPHCSYTQKSAHPMMAKRATPVAHRFFGALTHDQLRDTVSRRIEAYTRLCQEKPGAPGALVMLSSLRIRLAELDQQENC